MGFNPYRKRIPEMAARVTNPRTGTITASANETMFNDSGELNAYSKRDVIEAHKVILQSLQSASQQPQPFQTRTAQFGEDMEQLLVEAFADKEGNSWQVLGQEMGNVIFETMGREGLARRLMIVDQGDKGVLRFRVRKKDVRGFMVTEAVNIVPSVIRGHWVYLDEFFLTFNVHVDEREIAQIDGDILDEKYHDGLEQLMRAEDVVAKTLWDANVGVANDLVYFNTLTPAVFAELKSSIQDWGVRPVSNAVIASNLWDDILASPEFVAWFDPVTKRELLLEGHIGVLMGVYLYTDAFRYDTLKVMDDGEIYLFGPPRSVGGIVERMRTQVDATNQFNQGRAIRGWFGRQVEGMTCPNARAIAKGQRS